MTFRLNTLEEIKEIFKTYEPGMPVRISSPHGSVTVAEEIKWNFESYHYSIPKVRPNIDWNQVSEKYKWLAVDENGEAYLYSQEPFIDTDGWYGADCIVNADAFVSYVPGTVDWKDSLVSRESPQDKFHIFIFD